MEITRTILTIIEIFFITYLVGYTLILGTSVVVGAVSVYEKRKKKELKNVIKSGKDVRISILVPAYNEEITIIQTINSLINLKYKNYEIIIIDDGSKDNTSKKVIQYCEMQKVNRFVLNKIPTKPIHAIYEGSLKEIPIMLVKKENGGKADSLNVGINVSNYPWFICIDADSILQVDSLQKIVEPIIKDSRVVASGGVIMLNNGVKLKNGKIEKYDLPKNILANMQVIEYNRTFLASRIMFDKINANLIISGAFGLFRKDIVVAAGGYDPSTRGEDMELVIKLHTFCRANKIDYRMRYVSDAICWTQAPEKLSDLAKQRKRWHIGLFECMRKYKEILLKPEYGVIGSLAYLYFFIYEFLSPYIEIGGILVTIGLYFLNVINLTFMMSFFLFYTILGIFITIGAYFTTIYINELNFNIKKLGKVLLLCFFEVGFLRLFLSWVRFVSLIGYNKNKYKWDKVERKEI